MPTDTERREVARRLREYASWDEDGELVGCTEFGESVLNLLDGETERECFNALADLIEPGEPKVKCVAEVKVDGERLEQLVHDAVAEVTGIDRDALLALADELDRSATELLKTNDLDSNRKRRSVRREHAQDLMVVSSRIRGALGVVE